MASAQNIPANDSNDMSAQTEEQSSLDDHAGTPRSDDHMNS
jgi:hypothetical protein